jgi:hypothetical protein
VVRRIRGVLGNSRSRRSRSAGSIRAFVSVFLQLARHQYYLHLHHSYQVLFLYVFFRPYAAVHCFATLDCPKKGPIAVLRCQNDQQGALSVGSAKSGVTRPNQNATRASGEAPNALDTDRLSPSFCTPSMRRANDRASSKKTKIATSMPTNHNRNLPQVLAIKRFFRYDL